MIANILNVQNSKNVNAIVMHHNDNIVLHNDSNDNNDKENNYDNDYIAISAMFSVQVTAENFHEKLHMRGTNMDNQRSHFI
jgi:hypothetical protein